MARISNATRDANRSTPAMPIADLVASLVAQATHVGDAALAVERLALARPAVPTPPITPPDAVQSASDLAQVAVGLRALGAPAATEAAALVELAADRLTRLAAWAEQVRSAATAPDPQPAPAPSTPTMGEAFAAAYARKAAADAPIPPAPAAASAPTGAAWTPAGAQGLAYWRNEWLTDGGKKRPVVDAAEALLKAGKALPTRGTPVWNGWRDSVAWGKAKDADAELATFLGKVAEFASGKRTPTLKQGGKFAPTV